MAMWPARSSATPESGNASPRLGLDLLKQSDLDRLSERNWFLHFAYAPGELAQAAHYGPQRRREFLAGRFAAKEAVLKVLGSGLFKGVIPRDIVVARGGNGEPAVTLSGTASDAADARRITGVTVSITHSHGLVVALAVGW